MSAQLWRFSFCQLPHQNPPRRREEGTDPAAGARHRQETSTLSSCLLHSDADFMLNNLNDSSFLRKKGTLVSVCCCAAAHLCVKLQPLRRDGGDRDLLSTLSHSLCNLAMLQRLHGLSVDLQQHISILHACSLRWATARQLLQNMNCYAQGHYLVEAGLQKDQKVLLTYTCAPSLSFPAGERSQSPWSPREAGFFWQCGGGCVGPQGWAGWASSAAGSVSRSPRQSPGW